VEFCQVVTTTDSRDEADALARSAVAARLAACGQVTGPVASTYWWQGALTTAQEWQVLFKTTLAMYPALAEHIRANHSYDVPEVLCTAVTAGSDAYLEWIRAETTPAS
jgi:periplasmic divalent cation tolerance protein